MSNGQGLEIKVDFYGLRTLQNALKQAAPDLSKELDKTTRKPMDRIRNDARRLVPIVDVPSGWKRKGTSVWSDRNQKGWDNSKVRNGIVVRKNRRSLSGVINYWTLVNRSAAGAIFEFAKDPQTKPQGISFVRTLNRQPVSRLIWRAYDEAGGESAVLPAFNEAIRDVEAKFYERASRVERGDRIGLS